MFMAIEPANTSVTRVEELILTFRGHRVMLDSDLAKIYGVTTKQLNQALKRNAERFPVDFAFQLDNQEVAILKSQIVTSSLHGGRRKLPWVFTEHGAIMLASVLNSPVAVEASVQVVRAFVRMRELLTANKVLATKLAELEERVAGHDEAIVSLFDAIRQLVAGPAENGTTREIGFHIKERSVEYRVKTRSKR